jgi:hypothetical protein
MKLCRLSRMVGRHRLSIRVLTGDEAMNQRRLVLGRVSTFLSVHLKQRPQNTSPYSFEKSGSTSPSKLVRLWILAIMLKLNSLRDPNNQSKTSI